MIIDTERLAPESSIGTMIDLSRIDSAAAIRVATVSGV
jgi:hypothetical protein